MKDFWIKRYESGAENKNVLLIFPHWKASVWFYRLFAMLFKDFHTVVYAYADSLLSPNISNTIDNFAELETAVLADIKKFQLSGANQLNIYGVSLGSVIATRIASSLAGQGEVIALVLNLSAASFPRSIWEGTATFRIRKSFQKLGVTFGNLNGAWNFLSPAENMVNLKNSRMLFFLSLPDRVMVPSNVQALVEEIRRDYPKVDFHFNRFLGHRLGGIKNLLMTPTIKRFLKQNP
ncbi:MAG: thioesterase domain-containing protein [bacterium]|nr:thioesterase domain-containing protein [bacterium]